MPHGRTPMGFLRENGRTPPRDSWKPQGPSLLIRLPRRLAIVQPASSTPPLQTPTTQGGKEERNHQHVKQDTPSSSATPSSTPHITSNPTYLSAAPIDISAAQKQAERERIYQERRSGGLCTYCGTAGHFRAVCPRRRRRLLVTAEATITPPRVEEVSTAGKE